MNLYDHQYTTRLYWTITIIMCLFIAGSAVFDVAKTADAVALITRLGYPEYFIRFIGTLNLLAPPVSNVSPA